MFKETFEQWKFNSNAESNNGIFFLFEEGGIEYIWSGRIENKRIELTEGLEELLFNDGNDKTKIQVSDFNNWEELIHQAGLRSIYKSTSLYKSIQSNFGHGLDVITISSNPDELKEQLLLQLAAMKEGYKNTFSHSNAIMKELLKQKKITSKEYREILKHNYHI